MKRNSSFQQAPIRNDSVVGSQVYSHSGEFSPQVIDLELSARGVPFQFIRKYRSANSQEIGPLGRGWTFTYAKWIEQDKRDVIYHDGLGRSYRFEFVSDGDSFAPPNGFYAVLDAKREVFLLKQRYGDVFVFENPDLGGRLLAIRDRNGNSLRFEYRKNAILAIDPFERQIKITLQRGRIVELRDHARRIWQYRYNEDGCLVEVIQPPINGLPDRPRVKYAYDEEFRLASITDPNGQTFLRNFYDEQGRISHQNHGNGTFRLEYEPIGETNTGFPIYQTQVKLKNGGLLNLKHDAAGHVVERTLFVSAKSLTPEDRNGINEGTIPLTTTSEYNRNGELIKRTYPAGNSTDWIHDEENADPRARGNLLRVTQIPAPGVESDQSQLVTQYTYEPFYQQLVSATDPRGRTVTFKYDRRGNLSKKVYPEVTVREVMNNGDGGHITQLVQLAENFKYNEAGQLIQFADTRGVITEYYYYPTTDPNGAKSVSGSRSHTQKAGGHLARIVRDAGKRGRRVKSKPAWLATGFGYDNFDNVTTVLDGKGNSTRLKYNAHNRVISVISRKPFNYKTSYSYDANGNFIDGTLSFEHHHYDPIKQEATFKTTVIREGFEYNVLNNIIRQTMGGGDREVARTFVRDADENIVREIQPLGNIMEYGFDERNLMITRRPGASTRDETEIHHTYTRNGGPSSTTDGRGNTTHYHYDGFHRYKGFANAGLTAKKQWLDEIGNVTRIQVVGDAGPINERGEPAETRALLLLESFFQYDELSRLVRTDRAWSDPLTGEPLGKSRWDGSEGIVSSVVQYEDNHLPSGIWTEGGNVIKLQYDGVNRIIGVSDETGESVSIDYDKNNNPVRIQRLGPSSNGERNRFRRVITQDFDELDRLIARSLNGDSPESFIYNALGVVTEYKNQAGVLTRYLQDAFGRPAGGIMTATTPKTITGKSSKQTLLQRVDWDDNGRVTAWINARGHATRYQYDTLNRLSGIVHADGAAQQFQRDAVGNVTQIVDPNHTIITNRFDALNRLTERYIQNRGGGKQVEVFNYDGLNRLVAAVTGSATTLRRFDSLSRLLEEIQSGRTISYGYDSAGNRVYMRYPGGQEIHKTYDPLGRVVEVQAQDGTIAACSYGSGTQLRRQLLGGVLDVTFTYEPGRDRLSGIVYRSAGTGEIVEASKYRYDSIGNIAQETQLRHGRDTGERYFYDSANRLVKVQYGVKRLSDLHSPFEQEVLYELSPTGIWQRKTARGANGQTLEQAEGVANHREAYISLGNHRFQYDANGNRILEENGEDRGHSPKRYTYDYHNRLLRAENLARDGQVVQTIEYVYDAFNRQVLKRIARNGNTRDYVRVWDGSQLAEEWEDGKLARSFVYGGGERELLKMDVHTDNGTEEFFYMLNGKGDVAGLFNRTEGVVERYHYDVFGLPFLEGINGSSTAMSFSSVGNPFFARGQFWDANTARYMVLGSSFDSATGQFMNVAGIYMYLTSLPGIKPQYPDRTALELIAGIILIAIGVGLALGGGFFGIVPGIGIGILGAGLVVDAGQGSPSLNAFLDWLGIGGNRPAGAPAGQGDTSGSGGGGGSSNVVIPGSGGGSSQGGGGSSSGQPEDRPVPGADYGSGSKGSSGGSGGTSGGSGSSGGSSGGSGTGSGSKEHVPQPGPNGPVWQDTGKPLTKEEERAWAEKHPDKSSKQMPNPEDPGGGSGEGIDKNWWRGLPYKSIFGLIAELKFGPKVDEREQARYFNWGAMAGQSHLIGFLTPQGISVDERGETLNIDLSGVQGDPSATGTSTTDGWGDKPRTLAEAYAAPRIRDALTSRF